MQKQTFAVSLAAFILILGIPFVANAQDPDSPATEKSAAAGTLSEGVEAPTLALAPPPLIDEDKPHWTDGVHIIAGVGVNASTFDSRTQARSLGVGLNLRSDVGYYFGNGMGLELSGSVMFNKVRESLLWNTTFAAGFRFGLPFAKRAENFAPYGRILIGRATNVSIFDGDAPAPYGQYNANRLQLEGTMWGLGIGFFQRSSSGRIWYMELTGERHEMRKLEAITDVNDVPIVVAEETIRDNSELYAVCLTFGLMVF
ncbi:MAG: hypothetical protein EOP05_12635 [Proteobacteria bacterium]|nr:MAG: hypothetical protein EOP05_12635 [Pseudomonadota bacterium]